MQHGEESYYARYCKAGRRFQIIGGAVTALALLLHLMTGGHAVISACLCAGALLLLFGTANMRPNNQIKTFAAQLTNTTDRDFAVGLLDAITKNGKTLLSGRSLSNVEQAIYMYAQSKDADEAVVAALRDAVEKHLRKMPF